MTDLYLISIAIALCVVFGTAWLVFRSWGPKKQPIRLPGPPDGKFDNLFEEQRERAFLTLTQKWGKTFMQDGFLTTADPALAKLLFNSRAHSVGRAWPYRMVARTFPDSDGILFLADDAWRRRHSAFTPLFTGSNVRRYTAAMLRAAVSVAHRNALACAAHPTEPTRPVSGAAHGIGDGTAYDVLAAVRCISARVLCEWGLGVDSDSREACALADTLDAYARTVLEVIPGAPPPRTLLIGTLRAYARTFSQRATLRRQLADVIDRRLYTGDFTNAAIARRRGEKQPAGSASESTHPTGGADQAQWAPADSVSAEHGCPPNAVTRMLAAGFSAAELSSEVNHIHGAHKAAAFTASCALIELSLPGREALRAALASEFEQVCGSPDTAAVRAAVAAVAAAAPGPERDAAVAASLAVVDAMLAGAALSDDAAVASASRTPWRAPSREDLESGRLPLLSRVWRETLRRHVVSLGVMRCTGGDAPLAVAPGVDLPPGSSVLILLHALHHDPGVWGEDAEVWNPDRWLRLGSGDRSGVSRGSVGAEAASGAASAAGGSAPLDSFFPFLDGLRRCAGMYLAELQFAVILYALTAIYDLTLELPPPLPDGAVDAAHGPVPCAVHPIPAHEFASQDAALAHYALIPLRAAAGGGGAQEALDPRQPYHIRKRRNMFSAIDGRVPFKVAYRT